ncbi:DUF2487 family protein [Gorillibacterium sp. sgz5001074]|uniref:DUF2487 family protein n=1 Tax=Gorillibacterium sp. sgz5001074 TaxID=3446695 RepID=UPI003F66A939
MKFSEIEKMRWSELAPYMDTCLVPVTGLTGKEPPWRATEALEQLRDAMEGLERRYVGRVVTYPAFHYTSGGDAAASLSALCRNLKESAGFAYVVLITSDPAAALMQAPQSADLFLNALHVQAGQADMLIGELWRKPDNPGEGE